MFFLRYSKLFLTFVSSFDIYKHLMKMNLKYFVLLGSLVLGLTSCSDDNDDSLPVVDNKEWKADANKDTSVRPGDDFFMYCNGGYWKTLQ